MGLGVWEWGGRSPPPKKKRKKSAEKLSLFIQLTRPPAAQEFNRRFRHEMCAEMVALKVDAAAGEVVAAMLQLSRPHETRLQEDRSAPLAESAIASAVAEAVACGRATRVQVGGVSEVLRRLASDTSELVTCVGEGHGGASFCVNMKRIIDLIRMKARAGPADPAWGACCLLTHTPSPAPRRLTLLCGSASAVPRAASSGCCC